ncbi:MAG: hypothetical protein LAO06_12120 [Acidobacteriia bacterium]|nr:hypothetical protein [Terriglobia bacterium]
MLRVTVNSELDLATVKLAGQLASVEVDEAGRCAEEVVSTVRSKNVAVDLTEVTFIDEAGRRLLAALANEGVRLISDDPVMDAIVNQIVGRKMTRPPALAKTEAACTGS